MSSLGRLAHVEPREVWPHEAHSFTPWLLANVDVLSDLLGMDLVLEVAEHPVGDFYLDLKGYDEATGDVVIVENQLERSDHSHLGQIITYAAGTSPATVVWVATGFRPEHRAAIDWLNERTDQSTRFFAVAIRVVRIGDSEPAPNFELVAQPNDWEKQVKSATTTPSETDLGQTYQQFWDLVLNRIHTEHPDWTHAKARAQNWCNTSLRTRWVVLSMSWRRDGLSAQIYFEAAPLAAERFELLREKQEPFEAALGQSAVWDEMRGRKAAKVVVASDFTDVTDQATWPDAVDWLLDVPARIRHAIEQVGGIPSGYSTLMRPWNTQSTHAVKIADLLPGHDDAHPATGPERAPGQ